MSRIPTIYLETTMFNFPFVDDHAMRFKVQEERETMTVAEYSSVSTKRVERFFSEAGITPKYTSPYRENT